MQIRDLDQTVIGNPAHDLIRLGLSLASAARGSDLPGVITARILEELVLGYRQALSLDFESANNNSHRPNESKISSHNRYADDGDTWLTSGSDN